MFLITDLIQPMRWSNWPTCLNSREAQTLQPSHVKTAERFALWGKRQKAPHTRKAIVYKTCTLCPRHVTTCIMNLHWLLERREQFGLRGSLSITCAIRDPWVCWEVAWCLHIVATHPPINPLLRHAANKCLRCRRRRRQGALRSNLPDVECYQVLAPWNW